MYRQSADAVIHAGTVAGRTCSVFHCTDATDVITNATDTPNANTQIDSIAVDASTYARTSPASGSAGLRRNLPGPFHRNLRLARISEEIEPDHSGDHR